MSKNYTQILIFSSLITFALWLMTGFFTVSPDEKAIVMKFGKYSRELGSGLNYKLPEPLETVEKVSVTRIRKDLIGKVSKLDPSKFTQQKYSSSYSKESQMLTGDENIIDVHFYVQWRIADPEKYLFNIKDSYNDKIVKTAAESIMRQMIGKVTISEALSEKRLGIETNVKHTLQEVLDEYSSGIEIVGIGILYSYVSPEVKDAYSDVQSAKADKEKYINQAQAYRNNILPRAQGDAQGLVESALAIKEATITKAVGRAQKFERLLSHYESSKNITNKRLYLETMQDIYSSANKIIIDSDLLKNIVPLLSLKS